MKKILFMALALAGFLCLATACSDDDSNLSNLPAFDSGDFGNRVKQPEWATAVTWQNDAACKATYEDFIANDSTLVFAGNYEYKDGMNYSTGKEQPYWYYYTGSGASIYLSEGNIYQTSFNQDLDNLSWTPEVRTLYNRVWNEYYIRRSRLTYTFLVKAEGGFSADGTFTLDGQQHQVVNVIPKVEPDPEKEIKYSPAKIVIAFGDNVWNQYTIAKNLNGIGTGSRDRLVYVQDVRQTVLDNLDIIQAYNRGNNLVTIAGATEADNVQIDLNDIRKGLGA